MTKGGHLRYVITYNAIWANYKTESFVYHWLHAHAMFDIKRFATMDSSTTVNQDKL